MLSKLNSNVQDGIYQRFQRSANNIVDAVLWGRFGSCRWNLL